MSQRNYWVVLAASLLFGVVSIVRAQAIVGSAAGVNVSSADVESIIARLPVSTRTALQSDASPLTQAVRAELIRRVILSEASRAQLDRDPAIQADLERLKEEVLLRQWVARNSQVPKDYPSDSELQQAYEKLKNRANGDDRVRLAQIFISAPDGMAAGDLQTALGKVSDISARLSANRADFSTVAKTLSEHKESAGKGGELDYETESRLLPEIRQALKEMKPSDVPRLVKTRSGFHFIKLLERKPSVPVSLGDVKDQLIAELRRLKAEEIEQKYVEDLTKKAAPVINEIEIARIIKDSKPH